jgi:hypothetical protein
MVTLLLHLILGGKGDGLNLSSEAAFGYLIFTNCIGVYADMGKICVFSQRCLLDVRAFWDLITYQKSQPTNITNNSVLTNLRHYVNVGCGCLFVRHSLIDYSIRFFAYLDLKNVGEEK